MTTKHNVSRADEIFLGGAQGAESANKRVGVLTGAAQLIDFGTPADGGVSVFSAPVTPAGAGLLTLDGTTAFDWERVMTLTSSGDATNATVTITGKDMYGATLVEEITGGNATTVQGNKSFLSIDSVSVDAIPTTGTIDLLTTKLLGMPVKLTYLAQIIGSTYAAAAGDFGVSVSLGDQRQADESVATATTGNVRGAVEFNEAYGTQAFVLALLVTDLKNAYGVKQYAG